MLALTGLGSWFSDQNRVKNASPEVLQILKTISHRLSQILQKPRGLTFYQCNSVLWSYHQFFKLYEDDFQVFEGQIVSYVQTLVSTDFNMALDL